jgi:hypothetical protein
LKVHLRAPPNSGMHPTADSVAFIRKTPRLMRCVRGGLILKSFYMKGGRIRPPRDVLIEHEFDVETITWLKSRPVLKDFPKQLFDEAVKTWRKYLQDENWKKMKPEDKPRAFEYRHALYLLDYPERFTFATLETQYYAGKKLISKSML